MAKVRADEFAHAVGDILDQFADHVGEALGESIKEAATKSKKDLAASSPKRTGPKRTGRYAKGWRTEDTGTRLAPGQTVYNTKPGLPHLLEFSHALRGGGRSVAQPHIAPVNDKIPKMVEEGLEKRL